MRGLPLAVVVLTACAAFAAPSVSATPNAVVLGTDKSVQLTVTGDGAPLQGFASVGQLERDGDQAGDTAQWRWTPPDVRYPMTALLVFWTRAESASDIAVFKLPLIGRTDLKISTEPNARVQVEVQSRLFGPVQADGKGRASVPIEVPPGVRRARVLVDVGGTKSTREAGIDVPSTNPLAAGFSQPSFALDETGTLIVVNHQGMSNAVKVTAAGAAMTSRETAGEVALFSVKPDGSRADVVATVVFGDFKADARTGLRPAGSAPPTVAPATSLAPYLGVGGFAFGGANLGSAVIVGVGAALPFANLFGEVEAGLRGTGLSADLPMLGRADSRLIGVPITLGARYRFTRGPALRFDVRLGAGVILFNHTLSADFQSRLSEFGVRPEFFAALSASWRLGSFEPFAEFRAEWNQIRTPTLFVRPGGAVLLFGTRFAFK